MSKVTIELNLEDVINEMFEDSSYDGYEWIPNSSLSEVMLERVINKVSGEIKNLISEDSLKKAQTQAEVSIDGFLEKELEGIILRKLRSGEVRTSFRGFKTFDQLIEESLSSRNIENVIEKHVKRKAEEFAKDLKARYDNVFAAKVVQSLNQNNMLSDDVAKLLLGE